MQGSAIRLVWLFWLSGPGLLSPVQAEWFSDTQDKMGTRIEVQIWHQDADAAKDLLSAAMAEFDRIEARMSTYQADSEISQINATAADQSIPVSEELFTLIEQALKLSVVTDGAFDITYDSVGQLYDFRSEVRPSQTDIDERLAAIDYRHVQLDDADRTIEFSRPGVRINLGGIAKGYSVESVIDLLRRAGVQHALASAGGDSRLLGDRDGKDPRLPR